MKSLDPRVKILCILLCTTLALVFKDIAFMLSLCTFTLIAAQFLGGNLAGFFKKLRHLLSLLLSITVIQILFVRSGPPLLTIHGFVLITADGAIRGALAALRYGIILASAAIMAGENSRRTIQSLVQSGMPYMFAFMLQTALRFLPMFSQSFTDALVSIQLRGVELREIPVGKRIGLYAHLLLPVVADAIQKSQDLAMTMQARGFGAYKKRTSYLLLTLRFRDYLSLLALLCLFGAALALYIIV